MYRGSLSRLAAAFFAIAVSTLAVAGDVDTHLDRSRGRSVPVARARPGSAVAVQRDTVKAPETAGRKDEPVALFAAPRGECTCPAGMRSK